MLLDEVSLPRPVTPKGWQVQGRRQRKAREVERERALQHAGSSGHTVREEEKARRVGRAVAPLLRPMLPKKRSKKKIEDDALLADKKKRKRKPQAKKKGKPQPAGSAAHEAEAAVDTMMVLPTVLFPSPLRIVSSDQELVP